MRSEVSSRRRRSGVASDDDIETDPDGDDSLVIPDSLRTNSSSSFGGSKYCNHLPACLSASVAPSTFFRTSRVSSENFCILISSLGLKPPKTSFTAASTLSMTSLQPLCSSHQLKVRYFLLVSKSFP